MSSPAFDHHAPIPGRHSRDGENLSPPLEWTGVPAGAAELAVVCRDPDAPGGTFVHWVLWGLDATRTSLATGERPPGALEGENDFGGIGYDGPQPPVGDRPHRYFFEVIACSRLLDLQPGATLGELERAVRSHELARGVLVGTYAR